VKSSLLWKRRRREIFVAIAFLKNYSSVRSGIFEIELREVSGGSLVRMASAEGRTIGVRTKSGRMPDLTGVEPASSRLFWASCPKREAWLARDAYERSHGLRTHEIRQDAGFNRLEACSTPAATAILA